MPATATTRRQALEGLGSLRLRAWRARGRAVGHATVPQGVAFTLAYVLLGMVTLRTEFFFPDPGVPGLARTIWFPSALSLVFLLTTGVRSWPWIFAAEFLTTLASGNPLLGALGTGLGDTVEAVSAALLLRLVAFSVTLRDWRDVVALMVFAAVVGPMLGAAIAVLSQAGVGVIQSTPLVGLWFRWWLTHSNGILVLAPLLMALSLGARGWTRNLEVEAGVVAGTLTAVGVLLFAFDDAAGTSRLLLYVPFPLLLWSAYRFHTPGAALANLILFAPAVLGTAAGRGPFVGLGTTGTLLQLWIFLGVCALTSLVMAGIVVEREDEAQARLRAEEERVEMAERMYKAQKLESLGVLAGGIAHDFNNLLVTIMGNADLAERRLDRAHPAGDHVSEVLRASRRASDLCRQIQAYAGRGKVATAPVDLNDVAGEMVELLGVSFPPNAQVETALAEDLPAVLGDVTQLRQVVLNLLTNAADALVDGRGRVVVETGVISPSRISVQDVVAGAVPDDPRLVHLTVSDDGSGMTPDVRARVSEPFFSTKRTGRGLGLAVVAGIVRSHGGCLELRSSPGEGARFRMVLPATTRRAAVAAPYPPVSGPRGRGTLVGRALLVDDEESVRSVARRMLEEVGLEVVEAADGMEAVNFCREHPGTVDVVVLDVTMPRMDGYQALMAIRNLDPEARVILSTGNVEDAEDVAEVWRVPFLPKPYRIDQLHAVLAEILTPAPARGGP